MSPLYIHIFHTRIKGNFYFLFNKQSTKTKICTAKSFQLKTRSPMRLERDSNPYLKRFCNQTHYQLCYLVQNINLISTIQDNKIYKN